MKYKDVIFEGATFPDEPIKQVGVKFSREIMSEYIPIISSIQGLNKGLKCLAIIMAQKEGFVKGTRSYRTNNPANIGNVDSGGNNAFRTLQDGIKAQLNYIN